MLCAIMSDDGDDGEMVRSIWQNKWKAFSFHFIHMFVLPVTFSHLNDRAYESKTIKVAGFFFVFLLLHTNQLNFVEKRRDKFVSVCYAVIYWFQSKFSSSAFDHGGSYFAHVISRILQATAMMCKSPKSFVYSLDLITQMSIKSIFKKRVKFFPLNMKKVIFCPSHKVKWNPFKRSSRKVYAQTPCSLSNRTLARWRW